MVYRDVLLPPSETFIPRMYGAFRSLRPVYLGARHGAARDLLRAEAHLIAEHARGGRLGQVAYRQFGRVPRELGLWIERLQPALIHAQFGRGGALALPLARRCRLPLVVTFHGGDATKDTHYADRRLLRTIFQRRREALARDAAAILCVSDFVRERLIARGFPAAKLHTHRLGIELPEPVATRPSTEPRRVLFVGRLVEKKGVDDLIGALAGTDDLGRKAELVVVGDGPERSRLEMLARQRGVPLCMTGWLPPSQVAEEMARAFVLVVPSRTARSGDAEGIPTVLLEAQARGLPVIATRHGGILEAVRDGETGLLLPEAEPPALAAAIRRLLDQPDLHHRLRIQARRAVEANFDAARQSRRLEDLLLEVAAGHGTGAPLAGGGCRRVADGHL